MNKNMELFREIFEKEYTWKEGYMRNVFRFGDKTAMISPETGETWTYSELNRDVNRLANALIADGVGHGDVVMYNMLNCPAFVFIYLASHKIGAVNCPINYRLSAGEAAITIQDSKPAVIIYGIEQRALMEQAIFMSGHTPKRVIAVDTTGVTYTGGSFTEYKDYVKNRPDSEPVIDYELNIYDETTRLYTSGTTGRPKGVPLTSINEVLSAHDIMIHFPLNHTDITMNTTPWFHRGGLHCAGPAPVFYAGAALVVMRTFDEETCLDWAEKYGLTFIVGVPTVLERLADAQERKERDLSHVRGIVTMGSPLEKNACIRYQKVLTPNIYNGYGTTETLWNTFLRPFDLPEMAGTAGAACVDDDVRVVKVFDDRRAEPYEEAAMDNTEVGEVIIKSPAKSAYCYYNNEAETEFKFYKDYMYTGDLGTWDENKYISIVGRKDDMIISSGENIYPAQVEEVLNLCDKVRDCIVTAAPDKERGQLVTAYIIKADDSLTVKEIDEFCRHSPMIANYKRPRYYRFVDEIPFNATGKKLHYKAKEMAAHDLEAGLLIRI